MSNIPVKNCCGCTACYNICPKNAIRLKHNDEGFSFPEINEELCVNCGLCEKVCPIINKPELPKNFVCSVVAQSESQEILDESTSGGFIDSVYDYVINNLGGYGVGVAYNEQFLPYHKMVNTYDDTRAFRNSKYAQSELGSIFKDIKSELEKENFVFFVGTPCQVAGLKAFLMKEYDKLITADLVCRSIPSPKLWREYLDFQEKRYNSKIKSVFCRKKTYGYHSGALEILFENNKRYKGSNRVDYYMKSFHSNICSRESCYDCQFKTKHRCSDFTVFDCWNPNGVSLTDLKDNDRGFSNVVIHTQKGKDILQNLNKIKIVEADSYKIFDFAGGMESNSIERKKERDNFYKDIEKLGFEDTVKKYIKVSSKDLLIEKIKPFRYKFKRILK